MCIPGAAPLLHFPSCRRDGISPRASYHPNMDGFFFPRPGPRPTRKAVKACFYERRAWPVPASFDDNGVGAYLVARPTRMKAAAARAACRGWERSFPKNLSVASHQTRGASPDKPAERT